MARLIIDFSEMMKCLPPYWHQNEEMIQILGVHSYELNQASLETEVIIEDAFIMTMSESRVKEWEKALGLAPVGTLVERRLTILGYFSVISKLTEQSIKTTTASLYNNARASVKFENSTIKVKVTPQPDHYDQTEFPLLIAHLMQKKPCHIGLFVERYYSTWGEVKDHIANWGQVVLRQTWQNVLLFIAE